MNGNREKLMIRLQTKRIVAILFTSILILAIASFFIFKSKPINIDGNLSSTQQASTITTSPVIVVKPAGTTTTSTSKQAKVLIGSTKISVELARTTAQINKGLSGRLSLDPYNGMLFMFSKASIYRFWMPDMHFPLDLIWINNGKIVDISAHASNDFNPTNPVYYRPKSPAQYVLEVNADFCKNHGIKIGDKVTFENIPLHNDLSNE